MAQEIGESREAWGLKVVQMIQDFASNMKHIDRPFYIVFACKPDRSHPGVFRQTVKAYYEKPPAILGILVWYVDHKESKLEFVPELSAPYDMPIDERLLSTKSEDSFARVASQGQKLNAIIS